MSKKIKCYVILKKKENNKLYAAIPSTSEIMITKINARKQFSNNFYVKVVSPQVFKHIRNKFTNDKAPVFMGSVSWGGTQNIPKFMGKTSFGG